MRKTGKFLATLWGNESGISSVEYALLLAFVTAGIILVFRIRQFVPSKVRQKASFRRRARN